MKKSQAARPVRGRTRTLILDAAIALVSDGGMEALTLEAVAARAGVSRSGLHYHYTVKEHLLEATASAIVERLAKARSAEEAALPDRPERELEAYVRVSLFDRAGNDCMTAKALAAGPVPGDTIGPIRRYWHERFPPFAQAVGFDRAALVHAATEGLWFMEVLGLTPFTREERDRVARMLLDLVEGQCLPATSTTTR